MKFKAKRGSLELSVNAIVILVMAIAVLGLGLAFVRVLIKQGQEKFEGIIAKADVVDPATSEIPLKADVQLSVKTGKTARLTGSFFNVNSDPLVVTPVITCNDGDPDADPLTNLITVTTGEDIAVPARDFTGFYALVKVDSDLTSGEYLCVLDIQTPELDASGNPTANMVSVRQTQLFLVAER